jgi:hypothetical protein
MSNSANDSHLFDHKMPFGYLMKVTSVFIKYLNYACKITWIEFLITVSLVKNSIQISKRKHSVTSRFIWEAIFELVSHRDIQTLENNVWKHSRFALVFSYIVFSCLDIQVKHSLSLFIYYMRIFMLRLSFLEKSSTRTVILLVFLIVVFESFLIKPFNPRN